MGRSSNGFEFSFGVECKFIGLTEYVIHDIIYCYVIFMASIQ
jgi:hypothetical protein